jgi:hypothetical protein
MSRSGIVSFNKFLYVELRVSIKIFLKFSLPFIFTSITFAQFNYPLHIGDYWEYQSGNKVIITNDTLLSNGNTYFVFREYTYGKLFRLERQEDLKVYRYNDELKSEILYCDFTKQAHENVSHTILDSADILDVLNITCLGYQNVNIFGKNRLLQYMFLYDYWRSWDEEVVDYVTDSLGITCAEGYAWGIKDSLIGAIINGVKYGNQIVGVKENNLISKFELSQNYPNPFNPTTNIIFNLPNSHFTTLKVYNILGEEITTLINEKLESGNHYVTWNAKNFPSGLYYYRLISGDFVETKKMILIK